MVGAVHIGEPSAPISVSMRDAFEQGLRESDYLNRQDIAIENRYAKDADEISRAVNDLVTLRVDVIMTTGTPASLAAKRATSSIPIVAANMADPVADGLVTSLSRPGGDLTGNTFLGPELSGQAPPTVTRACSRDHPNCRSPASRRVRRTYNAKHANRPAGEGQARRDQVSSIRCEGAERFRCGIRGDDQGPRRRTAGFSEPDVLRELSASR